MNKPGTDYEQLRRAQEAIRAAQRGEIVSIGADQKSKAAPKAGTRAPKPMEPLDETARAATEHRAIALMRTMTDYYGITDGELDDERKRLKGLSDERLVGLVKGYEFASNHATVMVDESKAREAAIARSAQTASFFSKHGVTEEEIDTQRQEQLAAEKGGHRPGRGREMRPG